MTAKFDAFTAALEALCIEHDVHLSSGDNYDSYGVYVEDASDDSPAGLELDVTDNIPPTPEERAAYEARLAEERARYEAQWAKARAADAQRYGALLASKDYIGLREAVEAHAKEMREKQMRISTDPTDPAYIDDRPRKVWLNEVEIVGWIVADEFRRCVITGKGVMNGGVLIERLPDEWQAITGDGSGVALPPIDANFSGMLASHPSCAKGLVTMSDELKKTIDALKMHMVEGEAFKDGGAERIPTMWVDDPVKPVEEIAEPEAEPVAVEIEPSTEPEPECGRKFFLDGVAYVAPEPEPALEPVDEPPQLAAPEDEPEPSDSDA
jgi:hypothetical protein